MRACQRLHCLFLNMLKCNWRFALPLNQNMSTQERAVSHMGLLKKQKHSDLFGSYLPMSLFNQYAQTLWVHAGRRQLFTVCVFSISQLHWLVNDLISLWTPSALCGYCGQRGIVRMGGRKKARGKKRKKRRRLDEWCLWGSDNVCKGLHFLIKFKKAQISFYFCVLHCYCFS